MIYLTNFIYVDLSSERNETIDKLTARTGSDPRSTDGSKLAPTSMHWGASLVDNGGVPMPEGYRTLPIPKWSG